MAHDALHQQNLYIFDRLLSQTPSPHVPRIRKNKAVVGNTLKPQWIEKNGNFLANRWLHYLIKAGHMQDTSFLASQDSSSVRSFTMALPTSEAHQIRMLFHGRWDGWKGIIRHQPTHLEFHDSPMFHSVHLKMPRRHCTLRQFQDLAFDKSRSTRSWNHMSDKRCHRNSRDKQSADQNIKQISIYPTTVLALRRGRATTHPARTSVASLRKPGLCVNRHWYDKALHTLEFVVKCLTSLSGSFMPRWENAKLKSVLCGMVWRILQCKVAAVQVSWEWFGDGSIIVFKVFPVAPASWKRKFKAAQSPTVLHEAIPKGIRSQLAAGDCDNLVVTHVLCCNRLLACRGIPKGTKEN